MDGKRKTTDEKNVKYCGYQQLVRAGYIRCCYRNGFEKAEPFQPNKKTEVRVPIKEVYHTLQRGHKIMIQIQSSMFTLYDLNSQQWLGNIYEAEKKTLNRLLILFTAIRRLFCLLFVSPGLGYSNLKHFLKIKNKALDMSDFLTLLLPI